ncbi:MAG: HD domain-containing protein [Firmicutes bacterium]|nr:HD domain-containing protein [Bacillota bacterium]
MTIKKEVEFNKIVNDILKNDKFIELKYELHHGISRLEHSLHVARITYLLCLKFKIKNYEEITRAALLHDFYKEEEIEKNSFLNHPNVACQNAIEFFNVNENQQNIIISHMFPLCRVLPKTKDSYIVSLADKLVALYECIKYKVPLQMGISLIFVLNFLCIQR